MLTHGEEPAGPELWRDRFTQAIRFRQTLGIDATDLSLRVVDTTKPAVEFRGAGGPEIAGTPAGVASGR